MEDYIHQNFKPDNEKEYLNVIVKIRNICSEMNVGEILFISEYEYNILENAADETMKGKGHQCYGVSLEIKINR